MEPVDRGVRGLQQRRGRNRSAAQSQEKAMKHTVFFIVLFLVLVTCQACCETFENGPGGMRVDYTITGLSLSAPQDREVHGQTPADSIAGSYRHIRDYQITRIGRNVTFAGTASFANASSELPARLTVAIWYMDANDDSADVPEMEQKGMAKSCIRQITTSQPESFSLTINTPEGYKVGFELLLVRNVYTGAYQAGYTDIPQHHIRICGRSSDVPEWTTVVEPQGPTTTVIFHNTTTIDPWHKPPDYGGFVLTAALAAAVAAILAAAAITAAVKYGRKTKPDEVLRYILQLSTDRIEFRAGNTASFDAAVWKVTSGSAAPQPVPGAAISISLPGGCREIKVTPLTGLGTIHCLVTMAGPFTEPVTLTVEAQEGGTSTKAGIEVVPPGLEMEFF